MDKKLMLSAPIHNYGNILAVLFFPSRALGVEWIRYSLFDILRFAVQPGRRLLKQPAPPLTPET